MIPQQHLNLNWTFLTHTHTFFQRRPVFTLDRISNIIGVSHPSPQEPDWLCSNTMGRVRRSAHRTCRLLWGRATATAAAAGIGKCSSAHRGGYSGGSCGSGSSGTASVGAHDPRPEQRQAHPAAEQPPHHAPPGAADSGNGRQGMADGEAAARAGQAHQERDAALHVQDEDSGRSAARRRRTVASGKKRGFQNCALWMYIVNVLFENVNNNNNIIIIVVWNPRIMRVKNSV